MNFKRLKKKNKRGWIKIVEVFIAIMLMAGTVFLVIEKNTFTGQSIEEDVENGIDYVIQSVRLDNQLREEIISAAPLPVEWNNFDSSGLTETRTKIIEKTPGNLICEAKICELNDNCINGNAPSDKDVYSKTGYISADLDTYSPRQLKVFCWSR